MRSGLGLLGGMDDEPSLSKCSISIKQDGGRRGTVLRGVLVRTGFTVSPFCKKWYYYERLLSKNITCLWQKNPLTAVFQIALNYSMPFTLCSLNAKAEFTVLECRPNFHCQMKIVINNELKPMPTSGIWLITEHTAQYGCLWLNLTLYRFSASKSYGLNLQSLVSDFAHVWSILIRVLPSSAKYRDKHPLLTLKISTLKLLL